MKRTDKFFRFTDAPGTEADVIYIGSPVWWYWEASIIVSFLAAYDFTGK